MAEQKEQQKQQEQANVHVIVTYQVKEEKYDAFMEAITPMIIATNKEKGCIRYNIHSAQKDKCQIVMMEQWDCQESLNAHLQQAHVKTFNAKQKEQGMAAGAPQIFFCGGPLIKLDQ